MRLATAHGSPGRCTQCLLRTGCVTGSHSGGSFAGASSGRSAQPMSRSLGHLVNFDHVGSRCGFRHLHEAGLSNDCVGDRRAAAGRIGWSATRYDDDLGWHRAIAAVAPVAPTAARVAPRTVGTLAPITPVATVAVRAGVASAATTMTSRTPVATLICMRGMPTLTTTSTIELPPMSLSLLRHPPDANAHERKKSR